MISVLAAFAMAPVMSASVADRASFYKALDKVRSGMTASQVEQILGKPDDVWTNEDPRTDGMRDGPVWCYGSEKHLGFPLLGRVFFRGNRVTLTTAGDERQPFHRILREETLRKTLLAMYGSNDVETTLDTLWLVRTTNLLLPLGKEGALQAMEEYSRLEYPSFSVDNSLYFVLLCLFEVPANPGYLPAMPLGGTSPPWPKDRKSWPRFPISLQDDVPFTVLMGIDMGGARGPFSYTTKEFRKSAQLRSRPLSPPDNPFRSLAALRKSSIWPFPPSKNGNDWEGGRVLGDVLALVRSAYRPKEAEQNHLNGLDAEKFEREFLATGARWSGARQCYVPANGKLIPDESRAFPTVVWPAPPTGGLEMEVILRRTGETSVSVSVNYTGEKGKDVYPSVVRFIDGGDKVLLAVRAWKSGDDPKVPVAEAAFLKMPPHTGEGSPTWFTTLFHASPGSKVIVEVECQGQKSRSQPFEL